jgi:hypothetical protein
MYFYLPCAGQKLVDKRLFASKLTCGKVGNPSGLLRNRLNSGWWRLDRFSASGHIQTMSKAISVRTLIAASLFLVAAHLSYSQEMPSRQTTNVLRFFAVSEDPVPGGRYVDTPECPKVGYISNTPSLIITSLQSVATNVSQSFESINGMTAKVVQPSIVIKFNEADSKKFFDLTKAQFGRRILLSLGDRPLIAPVVREPIVTGTVSISFGARRSEVTNVMTILGSFVRPK